jgi:hypothetical protein
VRAADGLASSLFIGQSLLRFEEMDDSSGVVG